MSVNNLGTFLNIKDSHLRVVSGNVYAQGINIGGITVDVAHGLQSITNQGNATTNTLQFDNATTAFATTANAIVGRDLTVTGNALVSSNLTVTGNALVSSNLTVTGNAVISDDLTVTENLLVSNNLTVTGNTFYTNPASVLVDSNVVTEYTGPHDRPLRKYPEVVLTADDNLSTSGYKASVSSLLTGNGAFNAFDVTGATSYWHSQYPYYTHVTGTYNPGQSALGTGTPANGTTLPTTELISGHQGEWIKLQMPKKIKLEEVRVYASSRVASSIYQMPEDIAIAGSNDGTNWYLVDSGTLRTGIRESYGMASLLVTTSSYYSHLALIVKTIDNQGANYSAIEIANIEYYGREEGSGSLDTTLKSVYNVPATTGTQLEVYYDGRETSSYTGSGTTVTDISPNTNNGTLNGGVGFDSTYKAFTFDGTTTRNITATLPSSVTGEYVHSVSLWVKADEVSRTSSGMFTFFTIGSASSANMIALGVNTSVDGIKYDFYDASANVLYNPPITSNEWMHFVVTYSGGANNLPGAKRIYLNGKELSVSYGGGSSSSPLSLPTSPTLTIGGQLNSGNPPFTGSIANFRLYSKALNADQVKELYDYQKDYFLGSKSQVTLYKGHLGVGVTEPSGQLELAGDERIQEYPPRGFGVFAEDPDYSTHIEGHGVFTAYGSSQNNTGKSYSVIGAFDKTISPDSSCWLSKAGTYSTGNPVSATAAIINGIQGEFIALKSPYPIKLKSFTTQVRGGVISENSRMAKSGIIWGSNNGATWYQVHSWSGRVYSDGNPNSFEVNSTEYYSHHALQTTETQGNVDATVIGEWKLFGTPGPTTLDKGSLTLGRSLDVPRISRYDVDTETPRPEKMVVDFDTTVNSSPTDISGKGNHGTFGGSAQYSPADKAFVFDGTSGCNISGNHNLSGSNPVHTISGWIKKTSTNTGWEYLFTIGTSATGQMSGFTMNGGNLYFTIFGDGVAFNTPDNFNNNWQHIVGVYTGGTTLTPSNFIVYVNGVKVQTIAGLGNTFTLTGNQVTLGANTGDGERFIGQISNFKLYNVALEPSEVKKLYNLGRTGRSMVISDTAVGIGKVPEAQLDVRGTVNVEGDIFLNGFKIFQPITPIARDGLAVLLDASDPNSYPATGTIFYDTSGNGRHGTAQGSVGWTSSGQQSYFDFPGADADKLVQTSGSSLLYKDICIVFKVDVTSGFEYIISNGGDNSLRVVNSSIPSVGNPGDWSSGGTTYYVNGVATTSDIGITAGQWYILGGENKSFSSPLNYTLGYGYPGRALDGKIAFVALYNRVLSADEQLQNYTALKKRFGV